MSSRQGWCGAGKPGTAGCTCWVCAPARACPCRQRCDGLLLPALQQGSRRSGGAVQPAGADNAGGGCEPRWPAAHKRGWRASRGRPRTSPACWAVPAPGRAGAAAAARALEGGRRLLVGPEPQEGGHHHGCKAPQAGPRCFASCACRRQGSCEPVWELARAGRRLPGCRAHQEPSARHQSPASRRMCGCEGPERLRAAAAADARSRCELGSCCCGPAIRGRLPHGCWPGGR